MGMTMTQKILAAHAGLETVEAGELIEARLDLVLGNDITAPFAIQEFAKIGAMGVFDRNKDRPRPRSLRAEQGHSRRPSSARRCAISPGPWAS